MTDVKTLLDKAFVHFKLSQFDQQLALALSALQTDPKSSLALTLAFLALWKSDRRDDAASLLNDFRTRAKPQAYAIACEILSLLRTGADDAQIEEAGWQWLACLQPNDARVSSGRLETCGFKVLHQHSHLAERAEATGPVIRDLHGELKRVKTMDPELVQERMDQPSCFVVRNIQVVPGDWVLIDDDNLYCREIHNWPSRTQHTPIFESPDTRSIIASADGRALCFVPTEVVDVDEDCILLGSHKNYHYWLTEHLARLKNLENVTDIRALKIVVSDDLTPLQLDSLRQLGIPDNNLLRCPENKIYRFNTLFVPTPLSAVDVVHKAGVEWLREAFGPGQRDASYPKRIFVTRTKEHRRKFVNEAECYERVEDLGFELVAPDSMSFQEQNHILQNAEAVIGPYGTCLSPIAFAPLDCHIFELIDGPSIKLHRFNENIATQLGQQFHVVETERATHVSDTLSRAHGGFRVDPQTLRQTVMEVLGA